MRKTILAAIVLVCMPIWAQQSQIDIAARTRGNLPVSRIVPGVAGQCLTTDIGGNTSWATCASGGGSGTVTSFSAGTLPPLFTTSVATSTTTPALTFALSNFAAHTFLGNNTSSPAAPAAVQPRSTDLADFSATAPTTSGKIPIFDQPSGTYIPGDPLVQGLVADGSTTAENPVTIGGYDTAGTPALHRSTFINGAPGGTEYGIVTRNIPSGTQTVTGSVSVSNFPATQAVSAASLPLPTGAATSANQPALVSGRTPVDPSGVTSPISAAALPLPSGASTSAKQPALGTAGTPSADVITVQGATSMTAVKVDPSAVTSPVSAASLPLPSGAATSAKQPALGTAGTPSTDVITVQGATSMTALKVDPSAVTSPISAASLPLPTGAATSANQSTVKAASTQSTATDTSTIVQINPNQPQLTTPLNLQGAKTNNNAAPGATNVGTLPGIANAAPPTWTEGNQVNNSQDLSGNMRVYSHPPAVLGCYQVNGRTSTYAGLAAATPLFSFRWGDATRFAIINHVKVNVITTVAATTAGQAERELIVARSFSASDTGGTAVTLTGNNQKMRTSQGTSLVTDMRFGTTITAGTRTLDANPIASAIAWLPLNMTGVDIGCNGAGPTGAVWSCVSSSGYIDLLNTANGQDYPLVLAQNEGFIVRVGKDAMPSGATQQTYLTVAWCEASAY